MNLHFLNILSKLCYEKFILEIYMLDLRLYIFISY